MTRSFGAATDEGHIPATQASVSTQPYLVFSHAAHRAAVVALAGIFFLAAASVLAFACLSLKWPLVHDAPMLHYVGWLMHQGAVPYRDVFDMQFPGTYVIHWLVLFIPGNIDLVWRCFDLAMLTTTLVLLVKLLPSRHYWSACATCVAFALYYLCLGPFYSNGQRDMLMTPLLIGGVVATVAALEQTSRRAWHAFLAGASFGAACTIKPTGMPLALLELGYAAIWLYSSGQSWKRLISILAAAFFGLSLPIAAVLAWLYLAGGLAAFFDMVWNYEPIYASCFTKYASLRLWNDYPANFTLAVVFLLSVQMVLAGRFSARFGAAIMAVLGTIVHFLLQLKGFPYHMIPLMAFAFAVAFWTLDEAVSSRVVWRWCLGILVPAAAIFPQWKQATQQAIRGDASVDWRHERGEELADYFRARLSPGETVQICGTVAPGIDGLLRAGVREPTRFINDCHFFCHDLSLPYIIALKKEFLSDLIRNKPRFFILYKGCWFAPSNYARLDSFPELKNWLYANYVSHTTDQGYCILERRDR